MNGLTLRVIVIAGVLAGASGPRVQAQLAAPGESGIVMGHLHFAVTDLDAHRKFWAALGGVPVQNGALALVQLPGTFVMLRQAAPAAGTVGSTINHVGFEMKNLEAFCKTLEAGGITLDRPFTRLPNSSVAIAFLTDPWGTYIELTENLAPSAK